MAFFLRGRRRHARMRVFYAAGGRLRPGDLLFDGEQPILVVGWRTIRNKRVPTRLVPLNPAHLRPVEHRPHEYIYCGKPRGL
jgi:hypothetical protein